MSLLPTLFTIFGSILVAVITHWLPKLTERKQNFKERIHQAKEFHSLYLNRKHPKLVKDRAAQDLAFSTQVSYSDVEFLIKFDDFDFLIDKYIEGKSQLKPIKLNHKTISYAVIGKWWYADIGLLLGYIIATFSTAYPFLKFNDYHQKIEKLITTGNYVSVFNNISIPIISAVLAIFCLVISMKRL